MESDEEKPEFLDISPKNYDKDFTVTDASVVERVYSAFGQEPWYCIRIGKVGFPVISWKMLLSIITLLYQNNSE